MNVEGCMARAAGKGINRVMEHSQITNGDISQWATETAKAEIYDSGDYA